VGAAVPMPTFCADAILAMAIKPVIKKKIFMAVIFY
jgi:hypothetical protein